MSARENATMEVKPASRISQYVPTRPPIYDNGNFSLARFSGAGVLEVGGANAGVEVGDTKFSVSVNGQPENNNMLSSDDAGSCGDISGGVAGRAAEDSDGGGGGGVCSMSLGAGGSAPPFVTPTPNPITTNDAMQEGGTDTSAMNIDSTSTALTHERLEFTHEQLEYVIKTASTTTSNNSATATATLQHILTDNNNTGDTASNTPDTTTISDDNNNSEHSGSNNDISSSSATATSSALTGTDTTVGPIRNLRVRGQRKFLPEKTRHKRQTLQDMTRPLKQWLLRHRDNPYPSKAEKLDLVAQSQMTLTQVSNWFANARRRLKNTVKQPDLTWASRIQLYNSCVEGNAELFSIASDDSCPDSDDDMMEHRQSDTFHDDVTDSIASSSRTATPDVTAAALGSRDGCGPLHHGSTGTISGSSSGSSLSLHSNNNHHHSYHAHSVSYASSSSGSSPHLQGPGPHHYPAGLEETCASFHKYKHSILHRYLSDAHQQALILDEDSVSKSRDRHHSSSTGSRDFEELSTSSVSSPAHDTHHNHLDDFSEEFETMALRRRTSDVSSVAEEEDMYWKEIGAALALTSLARGRINVNT